MAESEKPPITDIFEDDTVHSALPPLTITTKPNIPAGIALDRIPNPCNLKPKLKPLTRKVRNVDEMEKSVGLGEQRDHGSDASVLFERSETQGKGKEKEKEKEKEKMKSRGKENIPPLEEGEYEGEYEGYENGGYGPENDVSIILRPSTSAQRTKLAALDDEKGNGRTLQDPRTTLLNFRHKASCISAKTLWDIDEQATTELKAFVEAEEGEGGDALGKMLDVVETFQAFRRSLEGYLERMGELGLGLEWVVREWLRRRVAEE